MKLIALLPLLVTSLLVLGQTKDKPTPAPPPGFKALLNQDYVGEGNTKQMLDLYVPESPSDTPRPLVVYIHGGGWQKGSKDQAAPLFELIKGKPFVGASVGYRLTDEAMWPSQIHDCKAAIRWLRAHAREHGIDAEKIAVYGISAGGHLVSMLGVTSSGDKELEGALGSHLDQSTRVTCVLDFCGPSNFLTFGGKGSTIDPDDPNAALAKLIGGPLKDKQDAGRNASPATYISSDDPPFLLIHGDKDPLVPYTQAQEFDAALDAAKVPATLLTMTRGGHVFFNAPLNNHMRNFLDRHLLGKAVEIPEGPIQAK
jgi:acetyl esterase/lipase